MFPPYPIYWDSNFNSTLTSPSLIKPNVEFIYMRLFCGWKVADVVLVVINNYLIKRRTFGGSQPAFPSFQRIVC